MASISFTVTSFPHDDNYLSAALLQSYLNSNYTTDSSVIDSGIMQPSFVYSIILVIIMHRFVVRVGFSWRCLEGLFHQHILQAHQFV